MVELELQLLCVYVHGFWCCVTHYPRLGLPGRHILGVFQGCCLKSASCNGPCIRAAHTYSTTVDVGCATLGCPFAYQSDDMNGRWD